MKNSSNKINKNLSAFAFLAVVLLLMLIAGDIKGGAQSVNKSSSAMGAAVFLTLYGGTEDNADAMISAIKELDEKCLSPTVEGSDIFRLNENAGAELEISQKTAEILKTSLEICAKSDSALNVALGKLVKLWGIDTDNPRVPAEEEIKTALETADLSKIILNGNKAKIGEGQLVDLGAIGKGAACDIAAETAKKLGVKAASISVGGSVTFVGLKPANGVFSRFSKNEGVQWSIGIRDPFGPVSETFASVKTGPASVSTSGNYEKYFEKDGVRYHHIFSPVTGYPSDSGLVSVTVFSDSGLLSDALSTICFVLGYEKSLPVLKEYSAEAVFVFPDKTVKATDGIKDSITIKNSEFTLV